MTRRSRRFTDSDSFFTADRRFGPVLGAASFAATQISAGTLVGAIGLHYLTGIAFVWAWVGIWFGWLLSAVLVAPQLRAYDFVTVPDYFDHRFGAVGVYLRGLSAVFIGIIYLVFTTAQYVAGGLIFEVVFGMDQLLAATLVALVALAYTVYGGMQTSVYTDAIQLVLLGGGLVVATVVGLGTVGGLSALNTELTAIDPALVRPVNAPAQVLGIAVAFGASIAIAPYEISRVYALRDPDTVRLAVPLSIAIQAVIAVCIALLGLIARARFSALETVDMAVFELALELFGPVAGGLLLVGVLAAILSTIDSVLLVTASAIAHDLYAKTLPALGVFEHPPEQHRVLRVTQGTTVLAALLPLGLVTVSGVLGELVQLIIALYAALLGATLLIPVVASLHLEFITAHGALGGMVSGLGGVVLWQALTLVGSPSPAVTLVHPVFVGVACSGVATVGVSLLTAGR
ncbi:MAG: hypothetical protein V5A55_04395 [Halovenus sp.]